MNRRDRRAAGKQGRAVGVRSDTAAPLAAAMQHHQAGRLFEAESLYRQVLALDPNHVGSLHHLGVIALQSGRPEAAIGPIERAIALNGRVPELHYNLGLALQSVGRLNDAAVRYERATKLKPDYAEAHMNLGNVFTALGRSADGAARYERVIALAPDTAAAHYNLGNMLARQGKTDEAIARFQRAVALAPALAEAHNGLGIVLTAAGRLQDAADALQRALAIDPGLAQAHMNLGAVRAAEGRPDAALACYRHALALNPTFAEAHNNLGAALMAQGALREAEAHLQQAISLRPDEIESYDNLARVLRAGGDVGAALGVLGRALSIRETAATKSLFAACLASLRALPSSIDLRPLAVRALREQWGRANDLGAVAALLLERDTPSADWIARAMQAWPAPLPEQQLLGPRGFAAANEDELLVGLLRSTRVCTVAIERFLTVARRALLDRAVVATADAEVERAALQFGTALAQQCFISEYVFACDDDELGTACELRDRLAATLRQGATVPAVWVCAVAAYFPLDALPDAEALMTGSWPDVVHELLDWQVREPRRERDIAATVACLTPIDDATSREVRQQYEANPYPRWMKADNPAAVPIGEYLRRLFPGVECARPGGSEPLEVLIAGCGTGQHAIETAQRLAGARVLGVDLSLASLSYAIRKTRELGLTGIDYAQADILALGAIGRSFDVIEASGVLHHLADPMAGWRVLASLLRPAGVMALGLYSAVARADVVVARDFIAARGYRATVDDIRRCRQELMADGRFGAIVASGDFFSTSGCRDLLFHAQEHRLTLPQIAAFLSANNLRFLGFEIEAAALNRYRTRFPADRAMTDLAAWDVFEQENPATFAGMYQFWVQRAA